MAAETLYQEGRLSVNAISEKLQISKSTHYSYLRYQGVEIGIHQKSLKEPLINPSEQIATITLQLEIENDCQFERGKNVQGKVSNVIA